VVALGRGGATETVEPGVTGLLVDDPSEADFADAMDRISRTSFDAGTLAAYAGRFSTEHFESGFRQTLSTILEGAQQC
jgi:glycosyltransferase involved in cell wall biosynthesis